MLLRSFLTCVFALLLLSPYPSRGAESVHDFSRWEKEITAFEAKDKTDPPPTGALLFIGSSTIRLWDTLAQDFPDQKIINRGFGGSQIVDATHFADRVIFPCQPKAVFLRAGGNDLWAGKSAEEVFGDFKDFVTKVHSKLPKIEIYYISLSPSISRFSQANKEKNLNELVKEFIGKKKGLKYIETYDLPLGSDGKPREELFRADKLHFNKEGYKLLTERVRQFLPK
jgi:lysophospholipase L1-like esterase